MRKINIPINTTTPLVIALVLSCTRPAGEADDTKIDISSVSDEELKQLAHELAHRFIITDGHVDLPYSMRAAGQWIDVSQSTIDGNFGLPRAIEGGLNAPFMSIYVLLPGPVTSELLVQ